MAVVVEAVERIVAAHPGQRVAVVCHGGVINAYAGHVLGIDEPLFFLPAYTSISRVLAASTGERSIAQPQRDRPPARPAAEPGRARDRSPRTDPSTPARTTALVSGLRGTCVQGRSLSLRTSPGRPSTRSPRMFFVISVVPPSIELARVRRNACCGLAHIIGVLRALHRVAVGLEHPLGAEQVDGELADVLVELGRHGLADRALGPGVADGAQLRRRGCW